MCHSLSRRGFLMAVAAAAAIGPQHLLARQDIQRL
ncbi:MAG: twin-arginine translocation signal domain-containing protein, partial [Chloroflexia bacterium]|nr:twin-arginine translocation signal domain-containing protein [Chloroflexia bacterium]